MLRLVDSVLLIEDGSPNKLKPYSNLAIRIHFSVQSLSKVIRHTVDRAAFDFQTLTKPDFIKKLYSFCVIDLILMKLIEKY